jgi:hypothetical protein
LDLPTHVFFGIAIGLVFFGQPFVALVIGLGALLPDLDREYWYIPEQRYADEQMHRALFHNVVMMAATYLVSPFLSLGVFLHVLQDSFTTVKDRGVEWFYPFTRIVKRGTHDSNGNQQPPSPNEHVYFYQEDPPGLVKLADPDLQEPVDRPVPWRRVYGFAQNSHLLDRGFLLGSVGMAVIWLASPANSGSVSHFSDLGSRLWGILAAYTAVGLLFASGETQSAMERNREKTGLPSKPDPAARLRTLKSIQLPLLFVGVALFLVPAALYWSDLVSHLTWVFSDPLQILGDIALVIVVAVAVIKWETRDGSTTMV